MTLKDVQKTYEDYGRDDPLYAVLSRKDAKDDKWDVEEFFADGRREISEAMAHLAQLDVAVNKGRAMDFGCGVGRLTQALCEEGRPRLHPDPAADARCSRVPVRACR